MIKTLGCKVNQAESQTMANQLVAQGNCQVDKPEDANLIIINTCTVTHVADRKSRQMIRKLFVANPSAEIIITGCVVENPGSELPDIGRIVKKENIFDEALKYSSSCTNTTVPSFRRTRKHILIQAGCNYFCSYCIIPTVRHNLSSRPLKDILEEAKTFVNDGTKELVLTGINLGLYENNGQTLTALVEALLLIPGDFRIRLGSIEPNLISDRLLSLIENNKKICPHLHIPLQGASDNLLKIMGRRYNTSFYLSLVSKIQKVTRKIAITTDIIVGHPGETAADFDQIITLLNKDIFLNVHLFMYSKREGTRSYDRTDHLADSIKKERMKAALGKLQEMKKRVLCSFINTPCQVLIEANNKGYSEHYIPCSLTVPAKNNSFQNKTYSQLEKNLEITCL